VQRSLLFLKVSHGATSNTEQSNAADSR